MKTKIIIVLIHDEKAKPYVLHSDKRFHENIIDRHGCHVVEYLSEKAAKKKARLQGCYAHGLRTRMIEEFLEEI